MRIGADGARDAGAAERAQKVGRGEQLGACLLYTSHGLRGMLGHINDLGGNLRTAAGMLRGERLDHVGGAAQDDGKRCV